LAAAEDDGVARHQGRPTIGLLDLGRRLVGDLACLLDQRLELLKAELRQEAAQVGRRLALVVGGLIGASAGAMLALLALGLWVGQLVGSTAGGLGIVGGALLLVGGALVLAGIKGLRHQRLVPETARQFRRDAEWIRNEV
jgi:uncharacterized membrane protein YqjE